jgi:hypothetical protein
VWHECRRFGVEFLEEARGRLDTALSPLLEEALKSYRVVAAQLRAVTELYPPHGTGEGEIPVGEKSRKAVEVLKKAQEAEAAGLQALERIVATLGGS